MHDSIRILFLTLTLNTCIVFGAGASTSSPKKPSLCPSYLPKFKSLLRPTYKPLKVDRAICQDPTNYAEVTTLRKDFALFYPIKGKISESGYEYLLRSIPELISLRTPENKLIIQRILDKNLINAASRGHRRMAKALLSVGANPSACTGNGTSVLDFAQKNGHTEVIKIIRDHFAIVEK